MTGENLTEAAYGSAARPINCDQVAWLLDAIGRYLPQDEHPRVSRAREMSMYGLLYEIMDVANLHFADDAAMRNGTPRDVTMRRYASKQASMEAPMTAAVQGFNR